MPASRSPFALLGNGNLGVQAKPHLDVTQPCKHPGCGPVSARARRHNERELISSVHLLRKSEPIRIEV